MSTNTNLSYRIAAVQYFSRPVKRSTTKAELIERLEILQHAFLEEVEERRYNAFQCQLLAQERDELFKRFTALEEQYKNVCKLLVNLGQSRKDEDTATEMTNIHSAKRPESGPYIKQEEDVEARYKPTYDTQASTWNKHPAPVVGILPTTQHNTTTEVHFSGYLPFMLKKDLKSIALTLGVSTLGLKVKLIDRIKTYLESHPTLRKTKAFSDLWWDHPSQYTITTPAVIVPQNPPVISTTQTYTQRVQDENCYTVSGTYYSPNPTVANTNHYRPPPPPAEPPVTSQVTSQYCSCCIAPPGYAYRNP